MNMIVPYGDTLNDGKVQVSFTLPLAPSPEALEAARQVALNMALENPEVVSMKDLTGGFSLFILYGQFSKQVDMNTIKVARIETRSMDYYQINAFIRDEIGRKVRIVGACTGSDAHTVGLDAIMNMKGYAGEYGLERYGEIETSNMGSQVSNEELITRALEFKADAILISQVVTQKEVHIKNLTHLAELLEAENIRDKFIVVIGGPRINHELALELGMDAGFGPGSLAPDVASFVVQTMKKRAE